MERALPSATGCPARSEGTPASSGLAMRATTRKSILTGRGDRSPPDAWAALADGTRRSIFKRLADGPLAVGELAHGLPVSRPAVSQHLKVLKCAGLISDRAVGRQRMYQVNPAGIEALRSELDVFWGRALDAYKLIADEGRQDG